MPTLQGSNVGGVIRQSLGSSYDIRRRIATLETMMPIATPANQLKDDQIRLP